MISYLMIADQKVAFETQMILILKIRKSKICRGGRSTIDVETIDTVDPVGIDIEVIDVEVIDTVDPWGGADQ